jgi:hypothetical protein
LERGHQPASSAQYPAGAIFQYSSEALEKGKTSFASKLIVAIRVRGLPHTIRADQGC